MQAQCGDRTRTVLMPRREEAIAKPLGDRSDAESWLRYCEAAFAPASTQFGRLRLEALNAFASVCEVSLQASVSQLVRE